MSRQSADTQPLTPPQTTTPPSPRRGCLSCFGCLGPAFLIGLFLLAILVFGGVAAAALLVSSDLSREIEAGVARVEAARTRQSFESTVILDRQGRTLWEIFGEGKRTVVKLEDIPLVLRQATVAVEDDTFYDNNGTDAPSIIAALLANLRRPADRPIGGSTITQQLVRHLAFDYEERVSVNYWRKAQEVLLAWRMTQDFSKDEILALYLNEIYYGNLAYGVEAAAQTYFGKPARDLTLAEAALLAGLPQSPVELDPYTNLEGAKARQWAVLTLMVDEGYITLDEANAAYLAPLTFSAQSVSLAAPHFAVMVRQLLEQQYGAEALANGGYRVTTTLDLNYQRLAEQLARQRVTELAGHNVTNAALVALKPGTGEVLALLGSVDYHDDAIDGRVNVTLTPQQPGSAIKPLTYAAALSPTETEAPLWQAADTLWDVPVAYPQYDGSVYAPVNYDGRFHGPVRLRTALANSYNVPAVLLLQSLGVDRFLNFAQRLGIASLGQDASGYGLALTLGGGEVTPLELTAAYAVLANGGYRLPPVMILRVEKSNGELVYRYQPPTPEPVIDPRIAFLISDILDDDAARIPAMGRDNVLALPFPAAAKTGTTNDFRDNWTVGYTPGLAVGVWVGNTDNSPMQDVTGLTGAAPLWAQFMQAVYANYDLLATLQDGGAQPPTEFTPPPGLERRPICALGSVTPGATECALTEQEWFLIDPAAPTPEPTPTYDPLVDGVRWESLDPSVWRAPALPLPPAPPAPIIDPDALPPQPYCVFPRGFDVTLLPPQTAPLVFLTPPRNQESLKAAYEWALANNVSLLPSQTCGEEMLTRDPNIPAVWRIVAPRDGDQLTGVTPIVGVADFDPTLVQFYKLEIAPAGQETWMTFGETHSNPVAYGTLETLIAPGLPAGAYSIRLVLVGWDGNYIGAPAVVNVTLGP